jgi:hypothetical protein
MDELTAGLNAVVQQGGAKAAFDEAIPVMAAFSDRRGI